MTLFVGRESDNTKARYVVPTWTDRDGSQRLVGSSDCLPIIDVNHLRMHEGRAYYVYKTYPDAGKLGVGSSINIALAWPAGVEAHASVDYQCGGEAEIYAYEAPTTNGGTAMTIHRRNRVITTASQAAAVLDPNVTQAGTEFYSELITSAEGQGNRRGAGGRGISFEFVLKPLTTYLFRLTNVNSNSQMAELRIDWYEG